MAFILIKVDDAGVLRVQRCNDNGVVQATWLNRSTESLPVVVETDDVKISSDAEVQLTINQKEAP